MDPDSCGVMSGFSPIGPWPKSKYSSLDTFLFVVILKCSNVWPVVLIGENPEEQQRLHMMGTLEDEIVKVNQPNNARPIYVVTDLICSLVS